MDTVYPCIHLNSYQKETVLLLPSLSELLIVFKLSEKIPRRGHFISDSCRTEDRLSPTERAVKEYNVVNIASWHDHYTGCLKTKFFIRTDAAVQSNLEIRNM